MIGPGSDKNHQEPNDVISAVIKSSIQRRKLFERLAAMIHLDEQTYDEGGGTGGPTEPVMCSTLMTFWLLYKWRWSAGPQRSEVEPVFRHRLLLASNGLRFLPEGSECLVEVPLISSVRVDRIRVDRTNGTVDLWGAIVGARGETLDQWLRFLGSPEYAGLRIASEGNEASISNVLLFLADRSDAGFWYLNRKESPNIVALNSLSS